jgi:3-keto-disaccharide hydrolase
MPKNISAQQVLLMSVCCLLFCLQPTAVKSQDDQWTPLFNGKDLSGWMQVGKGTHTVENGLIRSSGVMGLQGIQKGMGIDFHLIRVFMRYFLL